MQLDEVGQLSLKAYSLRRTLVSSVEREGGSKEVKQRRRPRRGRPGASARKAAKKRISWGMKVAGKREL